MQNPPVSYNNEEKLQDFLIQGLYERYNYYYPGIDWKLYLSWLYQHVIRTLRTGHTSVTAHYLSWFDNLLSNRFQDGGLTDRVLNDLAVELEKSRHPHRQLRELLKQARRESQLFAKIPETESVFDSTESCDQRAESYFNALIEGDRDEALSVIRKALYDRVDVKTIYLRIIQPCMEEIGRLWEYNRISVAREHYFTAATQMIMSELYPHIFTTERNGGKVIVTSVSENLHELGARMAADFFELEGYDTRYLGASCPGDDILDEALEWQPQLLALSISSGAQLDTAEELIQKFRAHENTKNIKILVGGRIFADIPNLKLTPGADYHATDIREGLNWANETVLKD